MKLLKLYGTQGCHLCEEAEQLLQQWLAHMPEQFELVAVDIIGDDALFEQYGVRIPVLIHSENGRELDWPFDMRRLDAFLG
jgi:thiol-disulfide isomerase/thioredoxin